MLCCVMHRRPAQGVIRKEYIGIDSMIEETGHFILIIFADQVLQAFIVTELINVVLLSVLLYNLSTYFAFSRVPIACDGVGSNFCRLYHLLAIWTEHRFLIFILVIGFLFFVRFSALRGTSLASNTASLCFGGYSYYH